MTAKKQKVKTLRHTPTGTKLVIDPTYQTNPDTIAVVKYKQAEATYQYATETGQVTTQDYNILPLPLSALAWLDSDEVRQEIQHALAATLKKALIQVADLPQN
jgi:hypothetical protein